MEEGDIAVKTTKEEHRRQAVKGGSPPARCVESDEATEQPWIPDTPENVADALLSVGAVAVRRALANEVAEQSEPERG